MSIAEPARKQRGTSNPSTKRRQETIKKCSQQSKIEHNQKDGFELRQPKKYSIYAKRKNRGFSHEHQEEINSLILSLWESHYIECPKGKGGQNQGGKQQNKAKNEGQTETQSEQHRNEDPHQNSSSHQSQTIPPTGEELNIINQEFQIFKNTFNFQFTEDALQFETLYFHLQTMVSQELLLLLVHLFLCIFPSQLQI